MINDKVQKQAGGDGSTNLQAQSMIIHQGITYSEAKEIALDVYKSNALQLSDDAKKVAIYRAEELSNDFFKKLTENNKAAISEMAKPGMQSALYEAQKQYAKTGDKDLEGLLVDILVERASIPDRNIQQIVLDEALIVAGKLTVEQMNVLTLNFMISQTSNTNINNPQSFSDFLKMQIIPFTDKLNDNSSCYLHLEYAGCGSIMETNSMHPIELILKQKYSAVFSKGFTEEKFNNDVGDISAYPDFFIKYFPYLNHPINLNQSLNLIQFRAMNIDVLNEIIAKNNITDENKEKLILLFNSTLMNDEEAKSYLLTIEPKMQDLFNFWSKSLISKFSLTTVGIAIALANYTRQTGIKVDLGIWIK